MGSRVFSFFTAIIAKIALLFDESLCGKCYDRFCAGFYKLYNESFISRFFADSRYSDVLKNSFFGKILNIPEKILLFLQKKLLPTVNGIINDSLVCTLFSKWADISIRFYGIIMCAFSAPLFFLRESGNVGFVLILTTFIVGILMIFVNRSLRDLFGGSAVLCAITRFFTEFDTTKTYKFEACHKKQIISGLILGLISSFVCLKFGAEVVAVSVCGILCFAFLIRYLSLGVFLTVILSPMLPTMALVGLSILCTAILCIHAIADRNFTFSKNPMNVFVTFFAIALIWGCINSFSFMASIKQTAVHLSFIMFYFVVVNTIRTKQQWIALIKLFLVSAFVVSLYGVAQNFLGVNSTESWLDENMFQNIKVRVYSFFNNPNVLGEFLVVTIPLTAAVIWGKIREEHKTVFGIIFITMAACMIFTWSRGAWLGMLFACALFFVIMDKRWVIIGVLALLLLPLLMVLSGNTTILERIMSVGNTADTSTAYRVSIWRASIDIIRNFWLSGIGIGSEAFKKVYPAYALSGAGFALHSHNLYLQIWVEMGLIGICSLISMILMFVKQVFSKKIIGIRRTSNYAKIIIAIGAGVLGFMLQGLTDYVWYNYKILMTFWVFIALGISGVNALTKPCMTENQEGGVTG